jgi:hypothetical protein
MKKFLLLSVLMLLPLVYVSGAGVGKILFGPEAFERSEGSPNVYDESFSTTEKDGFLVVFNGDDDEDSRVTSGTITLNGGTIVDPSELNVDADKIVKPVKLQADNAMQITLDGDPGGYIIVMVVDDKKDFPLITAGRLQLAWTSIADPNVTTSLRLKNGSTHFDRHYKVRFFNEDGTFSAASDVNVLPPHGSTNAALTSYLPSGSTWQSGSVEIVFVGRGGGRVLGFGVQTNSSLGTETAVPLQQGGLRHSSDGNKKRK